MQNNLPSATHFCVAAVAVNYVIYELWAKFSFIFMESSLKLIVIILCCLFSTYFFVPIFKFGKSCANLACLHIWHFENMCEFFSVFEFLIFLSFVYMVFNVLRVFTCLMISREWIHAGVICYKYFLEQMNYKWYLRITIFLCSLWSHRTFLVAATTIKMLENAKTNLCWLDW